MKMYFIMMPRHIINVSLVPRWNRARDRTAGSNSWINKQTEIIYNMECEDDGVSGNLYLIYNYWSKH